jgi:hypothetical protein
MASSVSAAKYILKRPWLKNWLQPLANWYTQNSGYRQLGLRYVLAHIQLNCPSGYSKLISMGYANALDTVEPTI